MHCGMPYVICDIDDQSVTHAEARDLIADRWEIPADVRARRRSKKMGKTPNKCSEHT